MSRRPWGVVIAAGVAAVSATAIAEPSHDAEPTATASTEPQDPYAAVAEVAVDGDATIGEPAADSPAAVEPLAPVLSDAAIAVASAPSSGAGPSTVKPEWAGLGCAIVPRRHLHAVTGGAGYAARAAAIADRAGPRLELAVTARVELTLELALGDCPGGQLITSSIEVTPRWDRDLGRGLDVTASIGMTPAPTFDDRVNFALLPTAWEVSVSGRLAARPERFAPAELDRAQFDAYAVSGEVRFARVEFGDCERVGQGANRACDPDPSARESNLVDVFPVAASLERIDQRSRRVDASWSGAMIRAIARSSKLPFDIQLDFPRVEARTVDIAGAAASVDAIWPVYLALRNPSTGTLYRLGYGSVMSTVPVEGADPEDEPPALFAVGAGYGDLERTGLMIGLERDVTFDMELHPALELRGTAEAWHHVDDFVVTSRAVIAKTSPMAIDGTLGPGTLTGGLEFSVRRRIWGTDASFDLYGGRGYYADLDGGAPYPEWNGMASLTLGRIGWAGSAAPAAGYR